MIAAYSQRYRESGRWKAAAWIGSVILFLAGLVLATVGEDAAVLGLLASAYLLCSRLILRPETTRAHREGVVLQEQLDTSLMGLPWNRGLAGRQLPAMDIEDLAIRSRGTASADGWYVDPGSAPTEARTLLCQLENAAWGRRDHRRFAVFCGLALLSSLLATAIVGLGRDVSLAVYVSAIAAPALPWLLDLADLIAIHWRAAERRGGIETELSEVWEGLRDSGEGATPEALREFQDRIFRVRNSSGRVPNWFYRLYRERNRAAIEAATERLLAMHGWDDGR